MKKFKDYIRRLNEASFRTEDLLKVCNLYGSLFSKGLSTPLKVWCEEDFKRNGEEGSGVRMANVTGNMFRFNFSNVLNGFANSKSVVLSSIDYWEPGNVDLEYPTTTCTFTREVNVIQIWKRLSDIITSGRYGEYTGADLGAMNEAEDDLFKMGDNKMRKDFLAGKGITAGYRSVTRSGFENTIADQGLEDEWREYVAKVSAGKPEKNTTEERIQKVVKAVDKVKYADPDVIFPDLIKATRNFSNQRRKLMTVCGMGGLGKTYEVKHTLEEVFGDSPNKYWVYIPAGKFTTLQFFQEVFDSRDKIICFDEADNIVTNDEIVTMLKPALDTSGDGQMTYNTGTKRMTDMSKKEVEQYCADVDYWHGQEGVPFAFGKRFGKKENVFGSGDFDEDKEITGVWMPSRFYFTGKMIFISNLPLTKIDNALLTRGARFDITFTLQGKIKRIQTVLMAMKLPPKQIETIISFLEKQDDPDYISVRTASTFIDWLRSEPDPAEAARLAATYG